MRYTIWNNETTNSVAYTSDKNEALTLARDIDGYVSYIYIDNNGVARIAWVR